LEQYILMICWPFEWILIYENNIIFDKLNDEQRWVILRSVIDELFDYI